MRKQKLLSQSGKLIDWVWLILEESKIKLFQDFLTQITDIY